MFAVNVDFRYAAGYPSVWEANRLGIDLVRCTSLPEMENAAAEYISAGIRVLAIYTGESNQHNYVMKNCTALQIGNEWAMGGEASWPTGDADDFVNVWSHVANAFVPVVHPDGLPLVGPGLWQQDYLNWRKIAHRLPKLSAAAVHVYNVLPSQSAYYLSRYRNSRPDLPLICTEWTARQPDTLAIGKDIDKYCDGKIWFCWGPGVEGHLLNGTAELGVLALAR